MEDDLGTDTGLDEPVGVDEIAVQLETWLVSFCCTVSMSRSDQLTGVVEDKVNPATLDVGNVVGKSTEVVSENVLLGRGEVVTTGRLELPDVLLGHIDEERQIGGVTPETDCHVSYRSF